MLVALVLPAAAAASPGAKGAIFLSGPKATAYGHEVTFAGRLAPARAGVRVGIFSGGSLVARTTTRRDGTWVERTRVRTPGPYRARALGLVSRPHMVTVHAD